MSQRPQTIFMERPPSCAEQSGSLVLTKGKSREQLEAENKQLQERIRLLEQEKSFDKDLMEEIQSLKMQMRQGKSEVRPRGTVFFTPKPMIFEQKPKATKSTQTEFSYLDDLAKGRIRPGMDGSGSRLSLDGGKQTTRKPDDALSPPIVASSPRPVVSPLLSDPNTKKSVSSLGANSKGPASGGNRSTAVLLRKAVKRLVKTSELGSYISSKSPLVAESLEDGGKKSEGDLVKVEFDRPKELRGMIKEESTVLELPAGSSLDEIIGRYWSVHSKEISKEVHFEDIAQMLQKNKYAAAISLMMTEPKCLSQLLQILDWHDNILEFARAVIDSELAFAPSLKALLRADGILYYLFGFIFQHQLKSFIRFTLGNVIAEVAFKVKAAEFSSIDLSQSPDPSNPLVQQAKADIIDSITKILNQICDTCSLLPREISALTYYLCKVTSKKFECNCSLICAGFIISRIYSPAVFSPERFDLLAGKKLEDLPMHTQNSLKCAAKAILTGCGIQHHNRDPILNSIPDNYEIMRSMMGRLIVHFFDQFFSDCAIATGSLTSCCGFQLDKFPCCPSITGSEFSYLQMLIRGQSESFNKHLLIQLIHPLLNKDRDRATKVTKLMKRFETTETVLSLFEKSVKANEIKDFFLTGDEIMDIETFLSLPANAMTQADQVQLALSDPVVSKYDISKHPLAVEASQLSFMILHPRFKYHLKVFQTDHYLERDPLTTGKPLGQWPLVTYSKNLRQIPHLEFVGPETYEQDLILLMQLSRINNHQPSWNFNNEESYLFSQTLYQLVPHATRPFPSGFPRFVDTPYPSRLPQKFVVNIFNTSGEMSKLVDCDLTTTITDLIKKAAKRFKLDCPLPVEKIAFKIVGRDEYLVASEKLLVKDCTRIRDMLKKGSRPSLAICDSSLIVAEDEKSFDYAAIPQILSDTSSAEGCAKSSFVSAKVNVCIDSLDVPGFKTEPGTFLFAEAGIFYGGRRISDTVCTTLLEAKSQITWNEKLEFNILVSNLPRESRFCFTVFKVVPPPSVLNPDAIVPCVDDALPSSDVASSSLMFLDSPDGESVTPHSGQERYKMTPKIKTVCDQTKVPLGWTSCRAFDHRSQLVNGTLLLPLLSGNLNPIGICVDSMGLEISETTPTLVFSFSNKEEIVYSDEVPDKLSMNFVAISTEPATVDGYTRVAAILAKDSLYQMTEEEKKVVWAQRLNLKNNPESLTKILLATPWTNTAAVNAIHKLLDEWPLVDPLQAIELLDSKFPDAKVRAYAVKCLSRFSLNDLEDWMMQLVQALKCETYHCTPLSMFLLSSALKYRLRIGHAFFWMLQAEMHIPEVHERFRMLMQFYLRGCGAHREIIMREMDLLDQLMIVNRTKQFTGCSMVCLGDGLPLPHDPSLVAKSLVISKCKVLDSARAPLWLAFENKDPLAKEPIAVLFKATDDLRQDMLALQVLKIMSQCWESEGMDMRITHYKCVALGEAVGMVEIVPDCTTIADIQKTQGGGMTAAFKERTIYEWLRKKNPSEEEMRVAVENFIFSTAGYCAATYLLGVGDRHNDNILLSKKGQLFHIDFGHILGNAEMWNGINRDRAPFVLTPEFVYAMGGKESENFQTFCDIACKAYLIVRRKHNIFINVFSMMLSTDIPEIRSSEDIEYLRTAFNTELSEKEAYDKFVKLISQSLGTVMTRINNAIHIAVHPHINEAHEAL